MSRIEPFDDAHLEAIARVLGDTHSGLAGSEIGRLLDQCNIADPYPDRTKWDRLASALSKPQRRDGVGNCILQFIQAALNPVRYVGAPEMFEDMRASINQVLSFFGLRLTQEGSLQQRAPAKTLSDAAARTKRLRDEMLRRDVHSQVLHFCKSDLLRDDCFDSVFEATKGLGARIREMTGLQEDGAALVDRAFGLGQSGLPMLAFNSLRTESERSEQNGLASLMKGVFGTFRNPAAHTPKVRWPVSEPDAHSTF